MQNRLEVCIFQRSFTQRLTKISTVSLGREFVQGSDLSFETSYDKGHSWKQYEWNIYGKGLCNLPIATSRVCGKSEEVCVRSCARNRVLRVDCEFLNCDSVITSRKDREDKGSMHDVIQGIWGITSRFDKMNRNTFFNHSSSAPSLSTVSLLTTTANCISKTNADLLHFGKAEFPGKKQVVMVRQQSGTLQWPIGYTTTGTGPYSDWCIQKRLGAVCRRIKTGGLWSKKVQDLHINQLELLAIKSAILTFNQKAEYVSHTYLMKMGRTKNPELMQHSKEIWEFLLGQGIMITAEHLPGNLNCKADWESRHQKDSSEWKLYPLIFSKICQMLGKKPETDLLASRLSNQLPRYYC